MDETVITRNLEQQGQWYGEPVGETVRRLTQVLGLTQGQLAGHIGLSAPMLSQLASGQRAKIANPAVLTRLQALVALAEDPELGQLSRQELAARIGAVREQEPTGVLSTQASTAVRGADAVQGLLRAVASANDVQEAAELLADAHPALAEVLRVYGLGRTADARAHYLSVVGTWPVRSRSAPDVLHPRA